MKLEHIAFDVPDPEAFIAWWCAHLGFRRTAPGFIADDSGAMCLEIYRTGETPAAPDYAAANAMTMHIAFVSADVKADVDRLVAAGARLETIQTENPDFHVAIVRDPWGVPVQLCRRAKTVFLT
jgi:catechol 2,3-dioxygenase-like lactoylglutathione lyase family enzyme